MIKRVITNPFSPIPKSLKSHVRGGSMIWAQRLHADISDKNTDLSTYDEIYIDHGVNFSGNLNLFGGLNEDIYNRLKTLVELNEKGVRIISLDVDCNIQPWSYNEQLISRLNANTTYVGFRNTDLLEKLFLSFTNMKICKMSDFGFKSVIYGDSHSLAYSLPNQSVIKINGKTLYSFLKDRNIIKELSKQYDNITLCLGSIDIRHHVFRNNMMPQTYANEYAKKVIDFQDDLGVKISVCAPVPVEYEERKIPKTGFFSGTPFYGSREKRQNYTMQFIEILESYVSDFDVVSPPKTWYLMDPKEYAKEIMELSSSVHISPISYRSIKGW